MARKSTKKAAAAAAAAPAANGAAEKTRHRNEMWYAIVGMDSDATNLRVLAIKPTVGQARKLYQDMNATFRMVATIVAVVRCVVVPSVRIEGELEETETVKE